MSLFERLNAEKGLQLPFFGTPVHGESTHALLYRTCLRTVYISVLTYCRLLSKLAATIGTKMTPIIEG